MVKKQIKQIKTASKKTIKANPTYTQTITKLKGKNNSLRVKNATLEAANEPIKDKLAFTKKFAIASLALNVLLAIVTVVSILI